MWHKFFLIPLLISIFFLSCDDLFRQEDSESREAKLTVSPASGYIGTVLLLTGVPFSSDRHENQLSFSGVDYILYPDSLTTDTLFSHIPYKAISGPLQLNVSSKAYVFEQLEVLEACPNAVVVMPYNLNKPVTEKASWYVEPGGRTYTWQGTVSGDTLTLTRYVPGGDEVRYTQKLKLLKKPNGGLPAYISFIRIKEDFQAGTKETNRLMQGIIKIQDFSFTGLVSGKLFAREYEPYGLMFWYDFSSSK